MNNRQKSLRAVIAARRRKVAALKLRGLRSREIQVALADSEEGMRNPETGAPWSLRTIGYDIAALVKQWESEAARDIRIHKARELAELAEHRVSAWSEEELSEVRLGIALEMKLLGTQAPVEIDARILHPVVIYLPDNQRGDTLGPVIDVTPMVLSGGDGDGGGDGRE